MSRNLISEKSICLAVWWITSSTEGPVVVVTMSTREPAATSGHWRATQRGKRPYAAPSSRPLTRTPAAPSSPPRSLFCPSLPFLSPNTPTHHDVISSKMTSRCLLDAYCMLPRDSVRSLTSTVLRCRSWRSLVSLDASAAVRACAVEPPSRPSRKPIAPSPATGFSSICSVALLSRGRLACCDAQRRIWSERRVAASDDDDEEEEEEE